MNKSTIISNMLTGCLFAAALGFAVATVGCGSDSDDGKSGGGGKCEKTCSSSDDCNAIDCTCAGGVVTVQICLNKCCLSKEEACADACTEDKTDGGGEKN